MEVGIGVLDLQLLKTALSSPSCSLQSLPFLGQGSPSAHPLLQDTILASYISTTLQLSALLPFSSGRKSLLPRGRPPLIMPVDTVGTLPGIFLELISHYVLGKTRRRLFHIPAIWKVYLQLEGSTVIP